MIGTWLARFRARKTVAPPSPDAPFYAVGDIHGRLDLLEKLLTRLDSALPLVCVGDYVDRGENSAGVLHLLADRPNTICLRGNHEDMMLAFLDDPQKNARRWLHNGGVQTLASFSVPAPRSEADNILVARTLAGAMGERLVGWMRMMPFAWSSGNVTVVHAALDPAKPVNRQEARTMLWGHKNFFRRPRTDGRWVVHGHTIVDIPSALDSRIAVDTGAFATDKLTAARIEPGKVSFLST